MPGSSRVSKEAAITSQPQASGDSGSCPAKWCSRSSQRTASSGAISGADGSSRHRPKRQPATLPPPRRASVRHPRSDHQNAHDPLHHSAGRGRCPAVPSERPSHVCRSQPKQEVIAISRRRRQTIGLAIECHDEAYSEGPRAADRGTWLPGCSDGTSQGSTIALPAFATAFVRKGRHGGGRISPRGQPGCPEAGRRRAAAD